MRNLYTYNFMGSFRIHRNTQAKDFGAIYFCRNEIYRLKYKGRIVLRHHSD